MSLASRLKKLGIQEAVKYLYKNPEKNMLKLLDWASVFGKGEFDAQIAVIRKAVTDPENPYYTFVRRLFSDIDKEVLITLAVNFFVNASLDGGQKQEEMREKYQCNIPWAILLDPTSACNLQCAGCWASEYGNKLNLSYEEINSIILQGKEMGVYMYIYTGGEPLVRKKDLLRLCEVHDDCIFLAFTNGTLIDEEFADAMLRVKNFVPAISLEGFEEATDSRRGEGVYKKALSAMKLLKEKKLIYGISSCYTRENFESISSEEYYDSLIDTGAYFIWYFHYMPVGRRAVPDLLPTPEQRVEMYRRIRHYRNTKPLFAIDFQNDGEFVGGCIAGGRRYLHINANGDMDPCVFIHYSDSNIREKTLLEGLQSPLFMAYREGQPFNENMLRPCPMLENPDKLRAIVEKTGAASTDLESPEPVEALCSRCDSYAENWAPVAEDLWAENRLAKKAVVAESRKP